MEEADPRAAERVEGVVDEGHAARALGALLQLLEGPLDQRGGGRDQAVGAREQGLLVVAADRNEAVGAHQVHALDGVRTEADHVPQAHHALDLAPANVFEHRAQRFRVALDVSENRVVHTQPFARSGSYAPSA
ncbi:MAG: hypothetical protein R3F62_19005 [Planctomycetota bacterium]